MMGKMLRAVAVVALPLILPAFPGGAAAANLEIQHKGMTLIAVKQDPNAKYDIPHLDQKAGLAVIKEAVDALYAASPFYRQEIAKLMAAGRVILAYDPAFPKKQLTQLTIAAFFPDFFKKDGSGKDFVAVVGRYGVKWPATELAAVVAHELVGHGMQHLRGHMENVRNVDLECEAYLYEEKAYQDLNLPKRTNEMINFRKTLEDHWCRDLRTWTRKNAPADIALWDQLNPDVPRILDGYLKYVEDLRRTGIAGRAVAAAKRQQTADTARQVRKLSQSKNPADHYKLGMIHLRGLGVDENPKTAAVWFEKAAMRGHTDAQDALAGLHYRGDGIAKNYKQAARWYAKAAAGGSRNAQAVYGAMLAQGRGVKKDLDASLTWMKMAADQGHERAKKAVPTLERLIAKRDKRKTSG